MSFNRTLITLLVRDATTHQDETLLITTPLQSNQTDQLNLFVNYFCTARNMNLLIIPPVSPEFRAWQNRAGFGEFQCEACNQSYLDPGAAIANENTQRRFCSNFCSQAVDQQTNQNPESTQE